MAKNYRRLWEGVAKATDDVEAVRALAEIVVDKQGRAFTLDLKHEEAELCVETLDYVSCDLSLPPLLRPQMVSPGHHRTEPQSH